LLLQGDGLVVGWMVMLGVIGFKPLQVVMLLLPVLQDMGTEMV